MTIEVTIRFANPNEAVERALGCVLLVKELATANRLIGGFYFRTERSPAEIFAAFEEEGFEFTDFAQIAFEPK